MSLSACSGSKEQSKPPAPQVGFVVAKPSAVPLTVTLGGRTVAVETSEVRPQVTGVIRARLFTEGAYVRQGQPLFQIDPSLYRAAVNQAQANLQSAQANAEAVSARASRYKPLAEMEAVSRQDYSDALAQSRQGQASVAQTRAALDTARINLRFTTVPAPISGRIGRSLFTSGALVSANQVDALAVIQRTDEMFVDMQQSSADLVALRRALASGGASPGSASVRLTLEDGSAYPQAGTVQFSEVTVNEATGTVTLRARFPNPEGLLLPGMFVQASFAQSVETNAFLVPQNAVSRDVNGDAVIYVVGAQNKAERRTVIAPRTVGGDWVVSKGLKPGDRIITQASSSLKNGMDVRPVPASTPQKIEVRKPGAGKAGSGQGNGG
ncbi:efflux RND transporter periplasmic adaptor subunit [Novosphingobium flavum]|uniref:efflux RND transporter periplasmic adaptor subunit n=1 Tax=Novosphingobium flavum TaxID=1778672 RepID=UPI001FEB118E|nr:efflux RND transporter periplasmic adaptor subunit [Novosphingobium flavum]